MLDFITRKGVLGSYNLQQLSKISQISKGHEKIMFIDMENWYFFNIIHNMKRIFRKYFHGSELSPSSNQMPWIYH